MWDLELAHGIYLWVTFGATCVSSRVIVRDFHFLVLLLQRWVISGGHCRHICITRVVI